MLRYLLSKISRRAFEEGYKYGHDAGFRSKERSDRNLKKEIRDAQKAKNKAESEAARLRKELAKVPVAKKEPIDYPETDLPLPKKKIKVKKLLTKHERKRRHEDMLDHARRKKLRKKLMSEIGFCIYCGLEADTLDHLVPTSRGGTNEESNLALSCLPCNQLKGALTYDEFMKTKS